MNALSPWRLNVVRCMKRRVGNLHGIQALKPFTIHLLELFTSFNLNAAWETAKTHQLYCLFPVKCEAQCKEQKRSSAIPIYFFSLDVRFLNVQECKKFFSEKLFSLRLIQEGSKLDWKIFNFSVTLEQALHFVSAKRELQWNYFMNKFEALRQAENCEMFWEKFVFVDSLVDNLC